MISDRKSEVLINNMMISRHSRKIAAGFTLLLGLMLILTLFDLSRMKIMQDKMEVIIQQHNVKHQLMMTMREGIFKRQVSMRDVVLAPDPFIADDKKTLFNSYALVIIQARNKFALMPLSDSEKEILENINKAMIVAYERQTTIIDKRIYNEQKISQAELNHAFDSQTQFIYWIDQMMNIQKNETQAAVMDAERSFADAKYAIFVLGGGALLLGIFIAVFVVRLTESQAKNVDTAMTNLAASRDELEQRVIKRTEQLSIAHDQALSSNKAKDVFLATMSHELRTPLNVITGYSELLEEIAEEENIRAMIPELKKIQAAAKHQLGLIDSLLDISKIEEGKLEIHPVEFDVEALVSEIEAASQSLMLKNHNKFEVDCAYGIGMMYSDNIRIRQILLNLISNAAKFTEKGLVKFNIRKDSSGDEIFFTVTDSGIGIPEVYIKKLFEKFSQEDSSTTRKYGGSGLGLSISKQLSELLHGNITVKSEKGKGSVFTLSLPVIYTT